MTYTATNVSYEELAMFGCDLFCDATRQKTCEFNDYDDDSYGLVLEDADLVYIRQFN